MSMEVVFLKPYFKQYRETKMIFCINKKIVSCLALAALLSGCATPVTQRPAVDSNAKAEEERKQQIAVLRSKFMMGFRLNSVGYSILKGSVSDCGEVIRQSLGFSAPQLTDFPEEQREQTREALSLDGVKRVLFVAKGSAAESAGLRVGDIILDSAGSPINIAKDESRKAAFTRLPPGKQITFSVTRDSNVLKISLLPDTICDYPLKVSPGSEVNAYADGTQIVISKGMMRFASDDRELALVIGHELGHNTMGHIKKKQTNAGIGLIFDVASALAGVDSQGAFSKIGSNSFSQEFEFEADYVGLYYIARAGYDANGAAEFWRRMAVENPAGITSNHSASHPATPERFLALELTSGEISRKQSSAKPLVPNKK